MRIVTAPLAFLSVLAQIPRYLEALENLAAPDGPLARVADLRDTLDRLGEPGGALDRLADVSETLDRLAGLDESLGRLASLEATLDRLGDLSHSLDRLATATAGLPDLPDRVLAVEAQVIEVVAAIDRLSPDLESLAGTTQRVGRLVPRMPRRRREPRSSEPAA